MRASISIVLLCLSRCCSRASSTLSYDLASDKKSSPVTSTLICPASSYAGIQISTFKHHDSKILPKPECLPCPEGTKSAKGSITCTATPAPAPTPSQSAHIELELDNPGLEIQPELYGHNLEFTRSRMLKLRLGANTQTTYVCTLCT